jgi:hypothetical protein
VYRSQGDDGVQVPLPRIHPLACFMAQQLHWARASSLGRLHNHTQAHNSGNDSGRVISPSQRPLLDNTQHSQERDIPAPGWNRACNPSKREAADPHLRPRGHWDRPMSYTNSFQSNFSANRILPSSYLFWAVKRLVDYL